MLRESTMRKLLSLALIALFVFGTAACSSNDTPASVPPAAQEPDAAPEVVQEPVDQEPPEANDLPEGTVAEAPVDASNSEEATSVEDSQQASDTGDAPVYPEGMYKIGDDMPAGTYMVFANDGAIISMFTVKDGSGSDADIIAIDTFDSFSVIEVSDGQYLDLSGSAAADIQATKELVKPDWEGLRAGSYLIGYHLEPGEYKILPAEGALISMSTVYEDCTRQKIAKIDNIAGSSYVTVKEGQLLSLSGCTISR